MTFDLICVGVIFWVWPIFLQSTMTVTQKRFKILSGHGFCYCDFDIWLTSTFIGLIYWPWPFILPNRMTVSHKLFKIVSGHGLCIKCTCDLDIWPSDLVATTMQFAVKIYCFQFECTNKNYVNKKSQFIYSKRRPDRRPNFNVMIRRRHTSKCIDVIY